VSVPGLTFWLVGFLLGLRHALEPDHLAAVSNLALTSGRPLKAALAGALWGLEHLFTLAAVAGVALALGLRLPAAFGFLTELVVALALAWLGLSTPLGLRVRRTMGPSYRSRSPLRNPFLWGVLHGLSGSAALVLLASSQLTYPLQATSPWVRGCLRRGRFLGYGVGAFWGMFLMSLAVGLSFLWAASRARRLQWYGTAAAALFALLASGMLFWEILVRGES